jgi:hypothetical protein
MKEQVKSIYVNKIPADLITEIITEVPDILEVVFPRQVHTRTPFKVLKLQPTQSEFCMIGNVGCSTAHSPPWSCPGILLEAWFLAES